MNLAEIGGGAGGEGDTVDLGLLTGSQSGKDSWGWQWQGPEMPAKSSVRQEKKSGQMSLVFNV